MKIRLNKIKIINVNLVQVPLRVLPSKKRNKVRKEILAYRDNYQFEIVNGLKYDKAYYNLYLKTALKSYKLNTFVLPEKYFEYLHNNTNVDKLVIRNKQNNQLIGIGYTYITEKSYCPWVLGLEDDSNLKGLYRNMLLTAVLRAQELGCSGVLFGLTAEEEKNKLGANILKRAAFLQMGDNFDFNELDLLEKYI